MKGPLILLMTMVFIAACNKDKYKPPTDLSRYTKKMAGKWNWKGWYSGATRMEDTGGLFEIVYINDTTIKFRGTIFNYERLNTDSSFTIHYFNPALKDIRGEAESIWYWHKGDSVSYTRTVDMFAIMGMVGHRK